MLSILWKKLNSFMILECKCFIFFNLMQDLKHEIILEDFLGAYFVLTFVIGCVATKIPVINLFLIPVMPLYYIFGAQFIGFVGALFYSLFKSYMTTHLNYLELNKINEINNTINVCVTYKGAELSYCSIWSFDRSRYESIPEYYMDIYRFLSAQEMKKNLIKLISLMVRTATEYVLKYGTGALSFVQTHVINKLKSD